MLNSRNLVIIEGGLTRDPEYKEEHGLITFSVAVDSAGRDGKEYGAGFFDVTAWVTSNGWNAPKVGEQLVSAYKDGSLGKGARVSVMGRLNQDRWEQDGQKRNRINVVAETVNVIFASKNATPKGDTAVASSGEPAAAPAASAYEPAPF